MTDLWVLRSLPRGLDGSNYGAGAELFDDLPTRWPAYGGWGQLTPATGLPALSAFFVAHDDTLHAVGGGHLWRSDRLREDTTTTTTTTTITTVNETGAVVASGEPAPAPALDF